MNIGSFYIARIKDNQIVKIFDYSQVDKNDKNKIKKNYLESGEYEARCSCNDEKMIITSDDRIFPSNRKIVHHDYCPRGKYKGIHNKGWSVDETSKVTTVTTSFNLNPNRSTPKDKVFKVENTAKCYDRSMHYQTKGKITVSALIKNLNVHIWCNKSYKGVYIKDKYEFSKFVFGASQFIDLKASTTVDGVKVKNLQKMFFKRSVFNMSVGKDSRFVYMYLDDIVFDKENSIYKITGRYGPGESEVYTNFVASENLVTESVETLGIKIEDLKNHNIILGGFVFKNKRYQAEFFELSFVRCNKYGLFSESNYEVEFYNMLSDHKIAFYKPFEPMWEYGGYIPDVRFLLEGVPKVVIGEIFGINGDKDYLGKREKKLNLVNTELRDKYRLFHWDAYNGSDIPSIQSIKDFLSNI